MSTFILGADHGGFSLKEHLRKTLIRLGMRVEDLSPDVVQGDDYPLIAQRVARHVAGSSETLGVLVCKSGFGMDIAANRIRGVRAIVARTAAEAQIAREHNHANILVLGEEFTPQIQAAHILKTWIDTRPSHSER
ncbi:RpiB/LacA/LacB family sugar-phosphate isomerase, partial [Patescibacteria group bacterium]|nr:RpiB/LacA/LacB family sugar-phosphate isomerase [Patescibacteria group bacterium]